MAEEAPIPGDGVPYLEIEPRLERFFMYDANNGLVGCRYCDDFDGPFETVLKTIIEHIREKHGCNYYNVGLLERSVEMVRLMGRTGTLQGMIEARAANPSTVDNLIKMIMIKEGLWSDEPKEETESNK